MSGLVVEHVTLLGALSSATLETLLATPSGATLGARVGTDGAGRPRTVMTLSHPDAEVVARARQALLARCRERGLRAFLV